jgi:hypothetical protein
MPTLNIQGRKVKVGDEFLSMTPEQQNETVEEIAASLNLKPETAAAQEPQGQVPQDLLAELSAMTQNPTKAIYDQRPGWQKPIIAAGDIANIMGDAATFGYGDKAAAAGRAMFTDKSYDEELEGMRTSTDASRARAGSAGLAADVVGSLAIPGAAASRGATMAGRLGTGAMTGAKGVGARAVLLGAEGAGYGALSAAGHDQDIGTGALYGAGGGALGSAAGDAVSSVVSKVRNPFKTKTATPDLSTLKQSAKDAYDAAEQAGVIIKPAGLQQLSADVKADLADFGFHPDLQPRVAVVLKEIDRLGQGNTTLKGVDVLRRIADGARKSLDPSEKALGNKIINKIDDFVDNLRPADVVAGDPLKGAGALKQARSLWTRVSKNERLIEAVEKAELRAASTGSGGNVENATRQNIRKLLEKGRGFTGDEKAAMEEIIKGSPGQNILRLAGKLSPSGNGLMAALGVGGAMANPMIGVASLGGMGAKFLADQGVMRGVKALDELIRSGGDAAALKAAKGTFAQLTQAQRSVIARLFMGSGLAASARQPAQQ